MTAQDVINQVYSSIQTTPQTAIIIPYINRTLQDLAKWSRWKLLRSPYQFFLTQPGVTDYWIGSGPAPAGTVNTGLAVSDIYRIDPTSVYDFSNVRKLGPATAPLLSRPHSLPDSTYRPGRPQQFLFDPQNLSLLRIFPSPDNQNTYRPKPSYVPLESSSGGSLPNRTYYVAATYVDSQGGESLPSTIRKFVLPANTLLRVYPSFVLPITRNHENVSYTGFNAYAGLSEQSLTKQNTSPVPFGSNWLEPTTGLISGSPLPINDTIAPLGGYLIGFRYFRTLVDVVNKTDVIPFPDTFLPVIAAGTAWYLARSLNYETEAERFHHEYMEGRVALIRDWNLMPTGPRFVHPDPAGTLIA
jgi:hypothetical protein